MDKGNSKLLPCSSEGYCELYTCRGMQLGDKSLRAANSISVLSTTVTSGKQVRFRLSDGHFRISLERVSI
jgi:hypothetical protein